MTSKAIEPTTAATGLTQKPFWSEKLRQSGPICLILLAAVAMVYRPVGGFEFVNYDDPDYVSANPHVQAGLNWKGAQWAFTSGHASNWHPLTWLSHMLDWQLFGSNPGPQHLVNAAFHALNTTLLFLVLRRMTGAHWRSALVAAFFGLHPLRVESVAWISERKDVLSTFFLLLTLGAYGRYVESRQKAQNDAPENKATPPPKHRKTARSQNRATPKSGRFFNGWWYGAALGCFTLGLMSKPMLVTLPFCLFLLDYWPLNRFRLERPLGRTLLLLTLEKAPLFLLAAGSSIVTFLVQRSGGAVSTSLTLSARVANALVAYVRYLGKTFWPEKLSVLYPHPGHWPLWEVIGSTLILAAILVLVLLWARQRPYLPVGWLWFLGTLVPVIGLVQVGVQSMADRYTYVPSIGLFVLLVWSLGELACARPPLRRPLHLAAGAALLACAWMSSKQIRFWHDSESLFQRAIEVTDNNYLAYNNLGFDLSAKGKLQEAKENYAKSLAINPQYPDALNNMGFALAGEKKFSQAIPYYEAALKVAPQQPEIHNNLGNALSELGQLDEAIEQYWMALRKEPEHADAHNNLGIALAMKGKLTEAETHFREAIRLKPNYASAHSNLGNALAALHQIPEAIHEYQESLQLNPNDAQAHNNLGNALVEQGRLNEALEQYTQALRLNANNPEAEFNLAIVLLRQNRKAEAIGHLRAALQLNPANARARRQLELLANPTQP